jgi:outer membrane immunogenic protein
MNSVKAISPCLVYVLTAATAAAPMSKEYVMRILINALATSALLFAGTAIVRAADAIDEIPAAPEAQEVFTDSGSWDGAYVGGKATYQWGRVKANKDLNTTGPGAGLYGGYNLQNGKVVYGGEVDLNYSGVDSTAGNVETKQGVNGSLRARVGYDLNPALVYGTAGLAVSSMEASDKTSSSSNTMVGLTAGAGVETMITDSITARTEYRFTDYQDRTFNLDSGSRVRGLQEHQINVGLGVKF